MTQLDKHVAIVRGKIALDVYVRALAWALLVFAAALCVAIVVQKAFRFEYWRPWTLLGITGSVVALGALIYAMLRRPSQHDAAVAIDERLNLKEKFSTALYARGKSDPFCQAAVLDAEKTATKVRLERQFPLRFPKIAFGTIGVFMLAGLLAWQFPVLDLFGKEEVRKKAIAQQAATEAAKQTIQQALAKVESVPSAVADDEAIKLAKQDLEALLAQPIVEPAQANRKALQALQSVDDAIKDRIKNSARFAEAKNNERMIRSLNVPTDEKGPVADARRDLAKGDFNSAIENLQKTVEQFDKMDEKQKEDAAKQMQQLANQMQQMANDPQQQQQLEKQLEQMGANQQQAQQMAQAMQQAAQGDKQAQQQLQNMAQQAMQQMNNGQGPTPQQQQQIQQMMQQMQAQANAQAQAQQMAQAAQQMAQAMQQAQQPGQQQPQQQPGQQGGQQQNQQNQQQAGGPQQQQQQMAQAQQQMQQMLQQMQAMQQDAAQIAAAQQGMQQAAQQQAGQMNGQGQPGGQPQNGRQPGQWAQGPMNMGGQIQPQQQPGQGPGGAGQGEGARAKGFAPGNFTQEISPSDDIEGGKVLASTFVKASQLVGDSKAALREAAASAEKEITDEVDQERISHRAQQSVTDYFKTMEQDAQ